MDAEARPLVILDLGDLSEYRDGHLPGAVHSYWLETVERDYPFYGTVLNQADESGTGDNQGKRIAWMRRHGIGPGTDVIAYDHGDGRRAARIVWFLHFLGHARASMLDGGLDAWRQAGQLITTDRFDAPSPDVAPAVAPQTGFYLSTSELQEAMAEPATLLVDIRTDDERNDTVDGQFPRGVIPGSIRAPWRDFLHPDNSGLIDVPASETLLEQAGVDRGPRVILYGRFGCDTNIMWLVLKRAGFPEVEVYDRGWIEWISTSGLPAEPLP
jgi:thiosulfate/3-mercaptopyruvate sulfurtransferase